MLITILNVVYVLLAIAMIGLILMQRGAGAQAGSGFGGGASGTVFGARGASNFLSKSTKWLAIIFFGISLGMAWYATHSARQSGAAAPDLGVMAQVPATAAPAAGTASVPAVPATAPSQTAVPTAPVTGPQPVPAPPQSISTPIPDAANPSPAPAQSPLTQSPAPSNGSNN